MLEQITLFITNHSNGVGAVILVGILSMLEVSKIKINPWSAIFGVIGKMMNKDLSDRIDNLEKEQKKTKEELNQRLDAMDKEANEKEARRLRASIISFADSCRNGIKHSRVQYENVIRDYDEYLDICKRNNLKNHYIDEEMKFVDEVFQHCSKENKFV